MGELLGKLSQYPQCHTAVRRCILSLLPQWAQGQAAISAAHIPSALVTVGEQCVCPCHDPRGVGEILRAAAAAVQLQQTHGVARKIPHDAISHGGTVAVIAAQVRGAHQPSAEKGLGVGCGGDVSLHSKYTACPRQSGQHDAVFPCLNLVVPLRGASLQTAAIQLHPQVVEQHTVLVGLVPIEQMGDGWRFPDGILPAKYTAVILSQCCVHEVCIQQPEALMGPLGGVKAPRTVAQLPNDEVRGLRCHAAKQLRACHLPCSCVCCQHPRLIGQPLFGQGLFPPSVLGAVEKSTADVVTDAPEGHVI